MYDYSICQSFSFFLFCSPDRVSLQRAFTREKYSFLIGSRYNSAYTLDTEVPRKQSIPRNVYRPVLGLKQTLYVETASPNGKSDIQNKPSVPTFSKV